MIGPRDAEGTSPWAGVHTAVESCPLMAPLVVMRPGTSGGYRRRPWSPQPSTKPPGPQTPTTSASRPSASPSQKPPAPDKPASTKPAARHRGNVVGRTPLNPGTLGPATFLRTLAWGRRDRAAVVEDDIGGATPSATGLSRSLHRHRAGHAAPAPTRQPHERSGNHPRTLPTPVMPATVHELRGQSYARHRASYTGIFHESQRRLDQRPTE